MAQPNPRENPRNLSLDYWAGFLGVSRRTLEKRIAAGALACTKIGTRVIVTHDNMQAFLNANTK